MTCGEMHDPAAQENPLAQTFPHAPQFIGSDCVLIHNPLQSVCGAAHVVAWEMQEPALQTWGTEASPALHGVPSGAVGFVQAPLCGLQIPARWQPSRGAHVTGLLPRHVPLLQVSLRVQAL
jgi:hypothetical protein